MPDLVYLAVDRACRDACLDNIVWNALKGAVSRIGKSVDGTSDGFVFKSTAGFLRRVIGNVADLNYSVGHIYVTISEEDNDAATNQSI